MAYKELKRYSDYEIDEFGNLRRKQSEEPRLYYSVNGHPKVILHGNTEYISRLVAETFIPNPKHLSDVMHIDGNKQNNQVSNLKWASHSDIQKQSFGWRGVDAPGGADPPKKIFVVETGEVYPSIRACARAIHGSPSGIRECLKGKTKHHKGFTFILID